MTHTILNRVGAVAEEMLTRSTIKVFLRTCSQCPRVQKATWRCYSMSTRMKEKVTLLFFFRFYVRQDCGHAHMKLRSVTPCRYQHPKSALTNLRGSKNTSYFFPSRFPFTSGDKEARNKNKPLFCHSEHRQAEALDLGNHCASVGTWRPRKFVNRPAGAHKDVGMVALVSWFLGYVGTVEGIAILTRGSLCDRGCFLRDDQCGVGSC